MSFVLDSSVALSWCFEDERTPATAALLDRVAEHGAVAPALWPLEVLNGLAMAERRKRIDRAQREKLSGYLRDLPVAIDEDTVVQVWDVTAALAARHGLTVYDAAYLEVAQRLGLPLATLDDALRAAARNLKVDTLGHPRDKP